MPWPVKLTSIVTRDDAGSTSDSTVTARRPGVTPRGLRCQADASALVIPHGFPDRAHPLKAAPVPFDSSTGVRDRDVDRRADERRRTPTVDDVLSDVLGQRAPGLMVRKQDRSDRKRRRGQ